MRNDLGQNEINLFIKMIKSSMEAADNKKVPKTRHQIVSSLSGPKRV